MANKKELTKEELIKQVEDLEVQLNAAKALLQKYITILNTIANIINLSK